MHEAPSVKWGCDSQARQTKITLQQIPAPKARMETSPPFLTTRQPFEQEPIYVNWDSRVVINRTKGSSFLKKTHISRCHNYIAKYIKALIVYVFIRWLKSKGKAFFFLFFQISKLFNFLPDLLQYNWYKVKVYSVQDNDSSYIHHEQIIIVILVKISHLVQIQNKRKKKKIHFICDENS